MTLHPDIHNYYLLQGLDFIHQVEDMDTSAIMEVFVYGLLPPFHEGMESLNTLIADEPSSPSPSTENLSQ
jgi:hypothetical protein